MQLGQREGSCNYISARSPAVGKLTRPSRTVTKAPLNPEHQSGGGTRVTLCVPTFVSSNLPEGRDFPQPPAMPSTANCSWSKPRRWK